MRRSQMIAKFGDALAVVLDADGPEASARVRLLRGSRLDPYLRRWSGKTRGRVPWSGEDGLGCPSSPDQDRDRQLQCQDRPGAIT